MEKRTGVVLRHKETGLYFDRMCEHTTKLWSAWRFIDREQLQVFLEAHSYAPTHKSDYEPVEVEYTIEVKE